MTVGVARRIDDADLLEHDFPSRRLDESSSGELIGPLRIIFTKLVHGAATAGEDTREKRRHADPVN